MAWFLVKEAASHWVPENLNEKTLEQNQARQEENPIAEVDELEAEVEVVEGENEVEVEVGRTPENMQMSDGYPCVVEQ